MGPRLASLALLLLALCRPAASTVQSFTGVDTQSIASIADSPIAVKKDVAEVKKVAPGVDDVKQNTLDAFMGNTLYALLLVAAKKYDTLPTYYKDALNNGVLCEFTDAGTDDKLNDKIKKIVYDKNPTDDLTEDQRTLEVTAAEQLKEIGSCNLPDGNTAKTCFCGDKKKTLLYCLALGLKKTISATQKTCLGPAIETLKGKGTNELGKRMETGESAKKAELDEVKTDGADAKFLCDAMDTSLDQYVEAVYAADALYWTLDFIVVGAIFDSNPDLTVACAKEEYKDHPVMKCACEKKKGIVLCFAKETAKFFQEKGYLDCPNKNFVSANKPDGAELKKTLDVKNAGGSSTPATAGNDTTTAPPKKDDKKGAAATSTALFGTLSAAAAMLLRQ